MMGEPAGTAAVRSQAARAWTVGTPIRVKRSRRVKDQLDYADAVAQQLFRRFKIEDPASEAGSYENLSTEERFWYVGAGRIAVQETIKLLIQDGVFIPPNLR
jgi:hypothetical protein